MMERHTNQRVEIIKIYYRNSESVASRLRALRPIYGRNNRPSRSTIERIVEKFESTGTVQNVPVPVTQRSARSVENIAAAEASVCCGVEVKRWPNTPMSVGSNRSAAVNCLP